MKPRGIKRFLNGLKLMACGFALLQATPCQTTAQELVAGLISASVTNIINSFVFDAFGLP